MKMRSISCKSTLRNTNFCYNNMKIIQKYSIHYNHYKYIEKHNNNNNNKVIYTSNFYFSSTPKRARRRKEYDEKWEAHMASLKDKNINLMDDIIEINQKYCLSLDECIKRVIYLSRINYDETISIECHMNLDPRKGKEYIRGNIILPNGIGKSIKICVFLNDKQMEIEALSAGVDIIGNDDLLKSIGDGSILNEHKQYPFDIIIATPDQLRKMVPYGRQLGPKGLMPNAKLGTLTNDPINAIYNAKKGQVSIRMIDAGKGKGIIQGPIGKCSFGYEKIKENIISFLKQIRDDLRPPGAKKQYFLKCILSSTQGRSYHMLVENQEPWLKKDID
eukprot:278145_1